MHVLPNNKGKIAIDAGNQVDVWDLPEQASFVLKGHIGTVSSVDFHPTNPDILVSGSYDSTIKLWDLRTPTKCIKTLNDSNKVYSVAFCPTQETELVSVNADSNGQALKIWSTNNSEVIAQAAGSWTAKYNHAGSAIVAGLPGKIILYDADNLQVLRLVELPSNWSDNGGIPGAFDFSKDDSEVIASGPAEDIFIFKGDLSSNLMDIKSGMLGVDSHWMENGRILSSTYGCSYDGGSYVRIWDVNEIRRRIQENLERGSDLDTNAKSTDCNGQIKSKEDSSSGCGVQ